LADGRCQPSFRTYESQLSPAAHHVVVEPEENAFASPVELGELRHVDYDVFATHRPDLVDLGLQGRDRGSAKSALEEEAATAVYILQLDAKPII
jgi:hypothetical protein